MSGMATYGRLLFIGTAVMVLAEGACAESTLDAAIKALHPHSAIVKRGEVDPSCGPRPDQVLVADFNGDGVPDYAVLLGIWPSGRQATRTDKVIAIGLAAFMGQSGGGGFRPFIVERFPGESPCPRMIAVEPLGLVRHWEDPRKEVRLVFPGIGRLYCEKSGRVFYWSPRIRGFRWTAAGD